MGKQAVCNLVDHVSAKGIVCDKNRFNADGPHLFFLSGIGPGGDCERNIKRMFPHDILCQVCIHFQKADGNPT